MTLETIRTEYPIGTLVNACIGNETRTVIVRGYGTAMFAGNDTDMALHVKDYVTGEKSFVETQMIDTVIG